MYVCVEVQKCGSKINLNIIINFNQFYHKLSVNVTKSNTNTNNVSHNDDDYEKQQQQHNLSATDGNIDNNNFVVQANKLAKLVVVVYQAIG